MDRGEDSVGARHALRPMRGYACVALDNPKFPVNVGSALRAADNYGAAMVCYSGWRCRPGCTDTLKTHRHLPLLHVDNVLTVIPYDCVSVAVDLIEGATPLPEYRHPERAFYVFGGEDATLGSRIVDRCRDVVFIPTNRCMNLAATVNVVLYDRLAKQLARDSQS